MSSNTMQHCINVLPLIHNHITMAEEKKQRVSLYMLPSLISDLDYIARVESVNKNQEISRTDLVNENLSDFVTRWQKKNGTIPKR